MFLSVDYFLVDENADLQHPCIIKNNNNNENIVDEICTRKNFPKNCCGNGLCYVIFHFILLLH